MKTLNQNQDKKTESKTLPNFELNVSIDGCHVQLPVSESKNSLFLGINSLRIDKKLPDREKSQFELVIDCMAIDIFIAKQIDQNTKYYLL